MPDGRIMATENGCFAKTFGLNPDDEPTIYGAVTQPDSYLENVSQHGDEVDFYDTSYTQNGRATFPFGVIESGVDEEIDEAHFLLILNRNENIIPAVAKLEGPQAAAFFMLGETQGTSAGGADEAGVFLRVPGTNPFFPMPHDLQGNRFLELLEEHPLEVYLMNTGRVGGAEDDERSKKVKIKHSSAIVKGIAEGTIEWVEDPDFGYMVASSVPGHRRRGHRHPPAAAALRGHRPQGGVRRRASSASRTRAPSSSRSSRASPTRSSTRSQLGRRQARVSANPSRCRTAPSIERFLDSPELSEATRRAYRVDVEEFASWLRKRGHVARRRRRRDAERVRGRARRRTPGRDPSKLAPATIARKLAAVRALLRFALGAGTRARRAARAQARAPATGCAEVRRGRRRARAADAATTRSRSVTARCSSSSTRPGCAAARRSTSISATSTSSRRRSTSAARAARSESSRSAKRPRTGCGST